MLKTISEAGIRQDADMEVCEKAGESSPLIESIKNSAPVLLGIFIFFNPFPHITAVKEICFYLATGITAFLILTKRIDFSFKTPYFIPFSLFAAWSFGSIFWAVNAQNSIHDFCFHLVKYVVLYFLLVNYFNTRKKLSILSWVFIVSTVVFAIWGIWYFYAYLDNPLSARFVVGTASQAGLLSQTPINITNIVVIFGIALSLVQIIDNHNKYIRTLLFLSLIPLIGVVVLSQTRGAILSCLFLILLLLVRYKKVGVIVLLGLSLGIAFLPINKRLTDGGMIDYPRIGIWYTALGVIKDYPIQGIGFGLETYSKSIDLASYRNHIPKEYRKFSLIADPHNIVLDITVRLGIVGLLLFFWIIGRMYILCFKTIRNSGDQSMRGWAYCLMTVHTSFFVFGLFSPVFTHPIEVVFCSLFAMGARVFSLSFQKTI